MPEFTGHRDVWSYIRTIWRWKLLILVFVIGAPAVAFLLEHGKPKQYAATATVSLLPERFGDHGHRHQQSFLYGQRARRRAAGHDECSRSDRRG